MRLSIEIREHITEINCEKKIFQKNDSFLFSFVDRRKRRTEKGEGKNKVKARLCGDRNFILLKWTRKKFPFICFFVLLVSLPFWSMIKESNIGFLIKGFTFYSPRQTSVASSVTNCSSNIFSWKISWHISCDARGKIYGCDNIWFESKYLLSIVHDKSSSCLKRALSLP